MRLPGKVALVTGSTQGIGEAIARALRRGGRRGRDRLIAQHRAGGRASPPRSAAMAASPQALRRRLLEGRGDQRRLAGEVSATFGRTSTFSSIMPGIMHTASIEETTEGKSGTHSSTSISRAPSSWCARALPEFRRQRQRQGHQRLVDMGDRRRAELSGLLCLERRSREPHPRAGGRNRPVNVNVNSIAPGNIPTPLNAHLRGPDMGAYIDQMQGFDADRARFLGPRRLTGTAVYIASPDSDAVHGVTIAVDAGWSAW